MNRACSLFAIGVTSLPAFAGAGPSLMPGLYAIADAGPNGNDSINFLDTANGAASFVLERDSNASIAGFEWGDGVFYAADTGINTDFFTIDPLTGTTTITEMTFPDGDRDAVTSLDYVDGTLYAGLSVEGGVNQDSALVVIDPMTGEVTEIGPMGIDAPTGGLTWNDGTLYTVNAGGGEPATLYTLDTTTGEATEVAEIREVTGAPVGLTGLEFGLNNILYGLGRGQFNNDILFRIDPQTGTATRLGDTNLVFSSSLTTIVPGPGTGVLAGLALLTALRRRR